MKRLITFFIIAISVQLYAQEGQFSQYFATSSLLNPAFTGTMPNLTFNSNYKRGGNPTSESYLELMQGTFTYPFRKITSRNHQVGGMGVTFFKERRGYEGLYSTSKVLLTWAYTMKLSRLSNQYLVFGLQGGVVQNKIDPSNLRWGSQFNKYISLLSGYDNSLPDGGFQNASTVLYPVFNFGVIYTAFDNENYFIRDKALTLGLSIDNLNRPTFSYNGGGDTQKFWLIKAFGSVKQELGPRWFIYPSGLVAYSQGSIQANGGLYFSTFVSSPRARNSLTLQMGSWYRVGDSVIAMMGFQVENIRLGFSVDLNTQTFDLNKALGNNLPTYEISLTYNLNLSSPLGNVSSPIF